MWNSPRAPQEPAEIADPATQIKQRANLLEQRLEVSLTANEQLYRESREALAQVIETVPALISAANREGRCVFVNALLAASVGLVPANLVGKPVDLLFGAERATSTGDWTGGCWKRAPHPHPRRRDHHRLRRNQGLPHQQGAAARQPDGTACVLTTSVDITNHQRWKNACGIWPPTIH